jgi:hypothetical protein
MFQLSLDEKLIHQVSLRQGLETAKIEREIAYLLDENLRLPNINAQGFVARSV